MRTTLPLALAALLLAAPAFAVGTNETAGTPTQEAQERLDVGDYAGALALLAPIVKAEPGNADALNLAGFASRKMGNLDQAAKLYDAALRADPNHKGTLEYQGEMWLEMGDRAKAEANLARLQSICGTCEEEQDLAAALAGS